MSGIVGCRNEPQELFIKLLFKNLLALPFGSSSAISLFSGRVLSLIVAIGMCGPALAQELTVSDARVRLPLPGQSVSVAYFTLRNTGDLDRELVAVRVSGAERSEIHEHRHVDGMMQMREVESVLLPAGGTQEFRPHGYHVMVFGLQPGDTAGNQPGISMQFIFSDGSSLEARAKIIR